MLGPIPATRLVVAITAIALLLLAPAVAADEFPPPVFTIPGRAIGLAFHPTEPCFVSADGKQLQVFRRKEEAWKRVKTLELESRAPAMTFSPDGKWLVASSKTGPCAFDTETWEARGEIGSSWAGREFLRFAFTRDSRRVFVALDGKRDAEVFSTETWESETELVPRMKATKANQVLYSFGSDVDPEGRLLVVMWHTIRFWNKKGDTWKLAHAETRAPRPHHGGGMAIVRFAPRGHFFALVEENGTVQMRRTKGLKKLKEWTAHSAASGVRGGLFTPEGKHFLTTGDDLRVWNPMTGELLRQFRCSKDEGPYPELLAISPDGKLVAIGLFRANETRFYPLSDLTEPAR